MSGPDAGTREQKAERLNRWAASPSWMAEGNERAGRGYKRTESSIRPMDGCRLVKAERLNRRAASLRRFSKWE